MSRDKARETLRMQLLVRRILQLLFWRGLFLLWRGVFGCFSPKFIFFVTFITLSQARFVCHVNVFPAFPLTTFSCGYLGGEYSYK